MTGHEIARKMLRDSELFGIDIFRDKSFYGDPFLGKYDMKQRLIILNDFIYDGESAKAIAVAIHECGHAIQHKIFYWPLMIDITHSKIFRVLTVCKLFPESQWPYSVRFFFPGSAWPRHR